MRHPRNLTREDRQKPEMEYTCWRCGDDFYDVPAVAWSPVWDGYYCGPCRDEKARIKRERGRVNKTKRKRLRRAFGVCVYCGEQPSNGKSMVVEHMKPLSRGGTSRMANLALSCRGCNASKGTMTAHEFMAERDQTDD